MQNAKELRKELIKALKSPKEVISKRKYKRKTVLPLNENVLSGVSQIIEEHFEPRSCSKFKAIKLIPLTLHSTKNSHLKSDALIVEKKPLNSQIDAKNEVKTLSDRPDSSIHILELLSNEKNRILKPTRTLHDKITSFLDKIRHKESEKLPKCNKKKLHHIGRKSLILYHPTDTSSKFSSMDKIILNCELTKQKYSDEKQMILHKMSSSTRKVKKCCRIVNRVIKRNSHMDKGETDGRTQVEKEYHLATTIKNKLQELYKASLKNNVI